MNMPWGHVSYYYALSEIIGIFDLILLFQHDSQV